MGEIAIIMAAGLGTRMLPLTKDTPKPLLPVNGTPLIETVIQGLIERPVKSIYIVTGFLSERFNYLPKKYENVKLIYNEEYQTKNNISSIYAAREYMGYDNCFICEGDLFLQDKTILRKKITSSCYYASRFYGYLDDWVFDVVENKIKHITRGGRDTYRMVGISYFTANDASVIRNKILDAYKRRGHEKLFWDEIVDENLNHFDMKIAEVKEDEIIEVDTVDEYRNLCDRINTKSS